VKFDITALKQYEQL